MDIAQWLRSLGLDRYEQAFRDNEVDETVLPSLTSDDLKDMGVSLVGHRRKLLDAIQILPSVDAQLASASGESTAPLESGSKVVARSKAIEAERRQLTVMFVDLAGSTELSRRLDPEEMRDVIQAYQKAVTVDVTRYKGTIAKFMGDGVLAYFGWPQAYEESAESAVRAGLALAEAVGKLRSPIGEPLVARIGIATGLVVVGEFIGEGAAQEEAVVGETPNLAARLQALAAPGEVVIAEATAHLLGRLFDLELSDRKIKGFADETRGYRVLRESLAESRFEALRSTGLTPLVGREHECGLLLDRWRLASSGEGQVVHLVGEAGIGKSRILQSLREALAHERHIRIRYYCSPYHSNSAFYPFINQLSRAADFEADDPAGRKLEKLQRLLAAGGNGLDRAVPVLAAFLSITSAEQAPPSALSPQRQKARVFETLINQLEAITSRQPVLMLLEDIHWIDPSSLELFDQIVDRLERLPLLLVTTSRPEVAPRWMGYPYVSLLTLSRLGRVQAASLIAAMTKGRSLPAQLLDHILARTDGVPLFVEELTKVVLESGLLRLEEDQYALSGPIPHLAIPATLQDSLMARLDRLAPVKEVAQIGAVIGREFSRELLEMVSLLPAEELDSALDQLVAAELIFRRGTPRGVSYSFKHALVQDAAYESLLRGRRQTLHAQIARALEDHFPDIVKTQPELLAHHFTHAGMVENAVGYWRKAGQLAMARSATAEAIAHLQSGLKIVLGLPESDERDRQELEIQLAMGSARVAAHGFAAAETGQAYERARDICERQGDITQLFPVLYGLCLFHLYAAEIEAARRSARRLLELAVMSNDRGTLFFAHRAAGVSAYPAGDFKEAREHLDRALALHDPAEHRAPAFVYAFDPKVVCLDYLARTLLPLGAIERSLRCNDEALAEARRIGHRNSLALPLFFGGVLRQLVGDHDGVRTRADELSTLAREESFRFWLAGATVLQGWAASEAEDLDRGVATMLQGIDDWKATGAEYMLPYFLVLLARCRIRSRQIRDAIALLKEAGRRIEHSGERWFEAEVHLALGDAYSHLNGSGPPRPEDCFRRALEIGREQSAPLWQLRAASRLASLRFERGRSADACHLLEPIFASFTEGFDTPDLVAAHRLLDGMRADRQFQM